MGSRLRLSRKRVVLLAGVLVLAGAGVAYATIPGGNGVFTACMLKNVGTVRLIDPSLPASNPMSHCSASLETQVSWNQQGTPGAAGPQGPAGPAGTNGTNGQDGTSVTVSAETAGANCANGGAKLVSASGTNYVCNGANGVGVVDSRSATNTVLVPAHSSVAAFASCNWAPGVTIGGASTTTGTVFVSSEGVGGLGSWQANAFNSGDEDGTVTVFVTCVQYG